MSFILDALKKADAERNLGHLPGIHTRQAIEAAQPAVRSAWSRRQKSVALTCGAAVVTIAIGAWQFGRGAAGAGGRYRRARERRRGVDRFAAWFGRCITCPGQHAKGAVGHAGAARSRSSDYTCNRTSGTGAEAGGGAAQSTARCTRCKGRHASGKEKPASARAREPHDAARPAPCDPARNTAACNQRFDVFGQSGRPDAFGGQTHAA